MTATCTVSNTSKRKMRLRLIEIVGSFFIIFSVMLASALRQVIRNHGMRDASDMILFLMFCCGIFFSFTMAYKIRQRIVLKIISQGGVYILKGFGKCRQYKKVEITAVKKWDYYCNFFIHRTIILWEREYNDCYQLIVAGKKACYVFPGFFDESDIAWNFLNDMKQNTTIVH